jgi:glucose-6-phosphate isomerase, archaeal
MLEPVVTQFTAEPIAFRPSERRLRMLSDMVGLYADREATEALLRDGDRVMYEMLVADVPEEKGHLLHSVTVMYPGRVGREYCMTAGHFHNDAGASEVYFCLTGEGMLLVQGRDGCCKAVPMKPGTAAYIPPGWAHRTANTGDEPFVFFAAWPGDAGHDYGTIRETGFSRLVVERDGELQVIDNPNLG